MRHRVPNSGKVLRERFVLLSSAALHCPSFSLLPPVYSYPSFSLCLTSPARPWFVLFSANAICCYSQRLTGYKDGQCVYTSLECGIASTLPWLSVCVCVRWAEGKRKGRRGGVSLRKRKGQRDTRAQAHRQAWLASAFIRQFYYLLVDRKSPSTLTRLTWGDVFSSSQSKCNFSARAENSSE